MSDNNIPNTSYNQEVNRLLSASLGLNNRFREFILDYSQDKIHGAVPEFGVDANILVNMAQKVQRILRIFKVLQVLLLIGALIYINAQSRNYNHNYIQTIMIIVVGSSIIDFIKQLVLWHKYTKHFRRDKFKVENLQQTATDDLSARFRILPQAQQNLIVYHGFEPFVGAGFKITTWSFPISLKTYHDKNTDELIEPEEFSIDALYSAVSKAINDLDMPNVVMSDYLYTYGYDVERIPEFMSEQHPKQRVDTTTFYKYAQSNNLIARRYKWITVTDWDGELVVSFFIRFVKVGKILYVEFNHHVIPPLAPAYRIIDHYRLPSFVKLAITSLLGGFGAILKTLWEMGKWILGLPQKLIRGVWYGVPMFWKWIESNIPQNQRHIWNYINIPIRFVGHIIMSVFGLVVWLFGSNDRYQPPENYGVNHSIREFVADPHYQRFFQKMDEDMYSKIVNKEILESITLFLETHKVSLTEFNERKAQIINYGTMLNNIKDSAVAFGDNSTATMNLPQRLMQTAQANLSKGIQAVQGSISSSTPSS